MPESTTPVIEQREHFGVYAACLDRGRVLAVRKNRGPYRGRLDLPGGTQEAKDVSWGGQSSDEMCLGALVITTDLGSLAKF